MFIQNHELFCASFFILVVSFHVFLWLLSKLTQTIFYTCNEQISITYFVGWKYIFQSIWIIFQGEIVAECMVLYDLVSRWFDQWGLRLDFSFHITVVASHVIIHLKRYFRIPTLLGAILMLNAACLEFNSRWKSLSLFEMVQVSFHCLIILVFTSQKRALIWIEI